MAKQGNRDRLNPRHCPSLELDSLTGRRSSDSIRASGNDCAAPKGRIDDCKPNPLLITKTTCNQGASIDDNAQSAILKTLCFAKLHPNQYKYIDRKKRIRVQPDHGEKCGFKVGKTLRHTGVSAQSAEIPSSWVTAVTFEIA